jgi:hypothetical protein
MNQRLGNQSVCTVRVLNKKPFLQWSHQRYRKSWVQWTCYWRTSTKKEKGDTKGKGNFQEEALDLEKRDTKCERETEEVAPKQRRWQLPVPNEFFYHPLEIGRHSKTGAENGHFKQRKAEPSNFQEPFTACWHCPYTTAQFVPSNSTSARTKFGFNAFSGLKPPTYSSQMSFMSSAELLPPQFQVQFLYLTMG